MLTLAFATLSTIGLALTTYAVMSVLRFVDRRREIQEGLSGEVVGRRLSVGGNVGGSKAGPHVSILKPLCGLDDELQQNIESFVALADLSYEVIFSIADEDDPALTILRSVIAKHPAAPFRVVTGNRVAIVTNPKVERLVDAARVARGEILLISDSNVRASASEIAETMLAFDDPTVGCVSNLFTGAGAGSFGARIESLHLLTFVVPGAVLAAGAGVPCVVGKSMAIRRSALRSIGGFERFRDRLAEDQAIGLAVKRNGYRVVLSPVVTRNIVVERTLRRAFDRQVRWNKIRFSFSPLLYSTEVLMNPTACAFLGLVSALTFEPTLIRAAMFMLISVQLGRLTQAIFLRDSLDADLRIRDLILMPVSDLVQLAAQIVPYFSRTVRWKSQVTVLGPGTVMMEPKRGNASR